MNEEKNSYKQIVQMIILLSCIKATEMKENRCNEINCRDLSPVMVAC